MLPGAASAHPLGNFTVNHFAAVDLAGNGVYVRYALDLAEIPTFQEGAEVRQPGYAAILARSLELRVDGKRVPLTVLSHRTSERPGAGGLKTMRFDAVFRAAATGRQLTFADHAYGNRIGWREIVVTARDGARVVDELRARDEPLGRAPRLPAEPPPLAARRPERDGRVHARELGGARARDRRRAGAGAPKRRLRVADPARRPLARRDPALAADRRVLGRGPRPHAGAREGARRRLPRRHARASRGTRSCSARP